MEKIETFGEFIKEKRMSVTPKITLKNMAAKMDMSLTLLSDIENGRKNPFGSQKIERFCEIMKLNDDDKVKMYDLAAREKNAVPEDITEKIMYTDIGDLAREALRKSKEGANTVEAWKRLIQELGEADD